MRRLKAGTIKRIVVNKHHVKHNAKHKNKEKPVISVQTSKGPIYGDRVSVRGWGEMIYRPEKPLKCGATVWLETKSEVLIFGTGIWYEDDSR